MQAKQSPPVVKIVVKDSCINCTIKLKSCQLFAVWTALFGSFGGKKALFPIPKHRKEYIEYFKKLMEEGKFKPVIDRTYLLKEVADAFRYVEKGEKTGNVVITVL